MSKTELIQEVEVLLTEIDKTHRYSMSKIYNLTNRVFNKKEIPQSCASCLIRKSKELRKWLEHQQTIEIEEKNEESASQSVTRKGRKRTKK